MSGKRKQGLRKLRFFLDTLLSMILLLAVFAAVTSRAYQGNTLFRRAEKADLVGPSKIIDRIDVPPEWPNVGYNRLIIGDDGEEILFYAFTQDEETIRGRALWRREKDDGILLTPVFHMELELSSQRRRDGILPLFLFVDDPAAVRAEVEIRLSNTFRLDLSQVRGKTDGGEEDIREYFFLFRIPVPISRGSDNAQLLQDLYDTNQSHSFYAEFPASIRLYDCEDRLLETREYTIRSRVVE